MAVDLNTQNFPIAVLTFRHIIDDRDITQAIAQVLGLLKRNAPFHLIVDLRENAPDERQAKMLLTALEPHRDTLRKFARGVCIVASSPGLRVALRPLLLKVKPPFPVNIEQAMALAQNWATLASATMVSAAARVGVR